MRNPDRLLPRLARGLLAIAAAAVASSAAAQSSPADAASAAVAAAAAALRPVSGSQKATVEELLRADAEAALRTARGAAEAAAPPAPAPATPAEPVAKVEPPKPEPVVVVEAIYGTHTAERDDRMVDLSVDGKSATLRRGDALSSFRLVDIDGACALVVKEAATTKARAKVRTKPAAPAKTRRVCIEDTRIAAPSFDNSLAVGGPAAAMPSPVFRQPVAPGQPIAPTSR